MLYCSGPLVHLTQGFSPRTGVSAGLWSRNPLLGHELAKDHRFGFSAALGKELLPGLLWWEEGCLPPFVCMLRVVAGLLSWTLMVNNNPSIFLLIRVALQTTLLCMFVWFCFFFKKIVIDFMTVVSLQAHFKWQDLLCEGDGFEMFS